MHDDKVMIRSNWKNILLYIQFVHYANTMPVH